MEQGEDELRLELNQRQWLAPVFYFRWRFPDDVLFFQVGRFMECYDIGTPDWAQRLGLRRMGWNRRGARYGFPMHRLGHCLSALLAQGAIVMVIRERSHPGHRLKQRAPVWRFVPVYSS